jgi:hypothetical protein
MIFRLSNKLKARLGAGTLETSPLHENPLRDWSAHLFVVAREPYILVTNTRSLYSTVMDGKGVTDEITFIDRVSSNIRETLEALGQGDAYERFVVPASGSVRFAKALNRSVTGSMNDMVKHAEYWLAARNVPPSEIGSRLSEIPMSALKHDGSAYGFPRDVFAAMLSSAWSGVLEQEAPREAD